jgi:hypothetical protein
MDFSSSSSPADFSQCAPDQKNFIKKKVVPAIKKSLPVIKKVLPVVSTFVPSLAPVAQVVSVL